MKNQIIEHLQWRLHTRETLSQGTNEGALMRKTCIVIFHTIECEINFASCAYTETHEWLEALFTYFGFVIKL